MANQKIIEAKQNIVNEIATNVKESATFVLFEYQGLSVADMTVLRRKLKETGSDLKIYKNTLTKRALDSLNINMDSELVGPKAMAYGTDAIAPIKVLSDFAKDHEALQIKAAYIEGKFLPKEEVMAVAKLPNREGMYSMLLACMKEPVAKVARVIQAVADAKGGDAAEEAAAE